MATEGVDYSWARPGGAALKAAGKKFAVRYIPYPGNGGKGLEKAELKDLNAHGLEVPLVFESTASRALAGRAAGRADAQMAQATLAPLGLPTGVPIYFAVDFDATPQQQAAIDNYLRGCADVIGLKRVGVYAGYWVVKRCKENGTATWLWQTYAWSGGQVYPGTHLYQYRNGQNINGEVDLCRALQANYGQPSKFGAVTPPPAPKPTPKPTPAPSAGTYKIVKNVPGYYTSDDAKARRNPRTTVKPGNYYVFNTYIGMVNVTSQKGAPGSWVNPGDNKAGAAPAPSAKRYVTVQSGWGLSYVAKAAGYKDWWLPTAWVRISNLNGYGVNWLKMNRALQPGQKVRVA